MSECIRPPFGCQFVATYRESATGGAHSTQSHGPLSAAKRKPQATLCPGPAGAHGQWQAAAVGTRRLSTSAEQISLGNRRVVRTRTTCSIDQQQVGTVAIVQRALAEQRYRISLRWPRRAGGNLGERRAQGSRCGLAQ